MYQGPSFIRLSPAQLQRFQALKTTVGLMAHGPLPEGATVAPHLHEEGEAIYVVDGRAQFLDGGELNAVMGEGHRYNAVRVPVGCPHGWLSLKAQTLIEHALGTASVEAVLAAA